MNLDAARRALAQAVTDAGQHCLHYPPDSVNAPVAFVDTVQLDYDTVPASAYPLVPVTATVIACAQRHDKTAATSALESHVGPTVAALRDIPGLRVLRVASGQVEISNTELPATVYTVTFQLDEES